LAVALEGRYKSSSLIVVGRSSKDTRRPDLPAVADGWKRFGFAFGRRRVPSTIYCQLGIKVLLLPLGYLRSDPELSFRSR
jgi:hypothetical protein